MSAERKLKELDIHTESAQRLTPLPTRKSVHQKKKKRSKMKVKIPVIQLLALFFILLPIGFLTAYHYLQNPDQKAAQDEPKEPTGAAEVVEQADDDELKQNIPTMATAETKENQEEKAEESKKQENKSNDEKEKQVAVKKENDKQAGTDKEREEKEKGKEKSTTVREKEQKAKEKSTTVKEKEREAKEKSTKAKEEQPKKEESYHVVYHTVQPQETVFSISMAYYKSQEGIPLIQKWNNLNGNNISVGQKLKIPLKK
ncbi:LysM peptidoglycan-binding domain-containing protein [Peribacillus asahii]|uniref:LysM peptidoglycan-binding domain-containing protein n=1 Tax=Peribacillus asahii TaxID=228899 RepID=A0A398BI12_9BACI|nr:LysM peptidoglycan-binding domain-containing protein [Peribacillus asahii]RID89264.1 LysM peptidoglycan-binding domain-containing protein [Peribacillus asahii]